MKSLISVDYGVLFEADDHDIISVDINTFVTYNDPLSPIFFILEQKKISISNIKLAFPIDEVDGLVYDRWFVVNLNQIVS